MSRASAYLKWKEFKSLESLVVNAIIDSFRAIKGINDWQRNSWTGVQRKYIWHYVRKQENGEWLAEINKSAH